MRHLNEYQHHLRVLLEPYDAKVSRTVLRGESPSNGADLLDFHIIYNKQTDSLSGNPSTIIPCMFYKDVSSIS